MRYPGDFLYVRKIFPDESKLLSGDSNAKKQKGEEQYFAIMCSSILSKYAFYQYFNNMSRSLKVKLPRGNTSSVVDHVAVSIAKKYGKKMLLKVTKTNMTNYKRIKDVI